MLRINPDGSSSPLEPHEIAHMDQQTAQHHELLHFFTSNIHMASQLAADGDPEGSGVYAQAIHDRLLELHDDKFLILNFISYTLGQFYMASTYIGEAQAAVLEVVRIITPGLPPELATAVQHVLPKEHEEDGETL